MKGEVTWDPPPTGAGHFYGMGATWPTALERRSASSVVRFSSAPAGTLAQEADFVETDIDGDELEERPGVPVAQLSTFGGSQLLQDVEARLRELQIQYLDDYGREMHHPAQFALKVLLLSVPGLRRPLLSATPSGHLVATWRAGTDALSVRLIGPGELHFALTGATGVKRFDMSSPSVFFSAEPQAVKIARSL